MKYHCVSCLLMAAIHIVPIVSGCNRSGKGQKVTGGNQVDEPPGSPGTAGEVMLPAFMVEGKKGYDQYCLTCHQASGSGVSGLNPPLSNTEYVTGEKERLLGIVLNGSNVGLDVNGKTYANAMPSFSHLDDNAIAGITSYIRNSFGNNASRISPGEIASFRKNQKP